MTMGIVEVEQNRLRQQKIEVEALVALMACGETATIRWKAQRKLELIAYPEETARKINRELSEYE